MMASSLAPQGTNGAVEGVDDGVLEGSDVGTDDGVALGSAEN